MKLSSVSHRLVRVICLASLIVVMSSGAALSAQNADQKAAQKAAQRAARVRGAVFGKSINTADSPEDMLFAIRLYVEEVELSLGLGQRQVSKLNLAAKLVAKRVFEENAPMFLAPRNSGLRSTEVEESFSDEDSESEVDPNAFERKLTEIHSPVGIQTALTHKVWLRAIGSILTDDQKSKIQSLEEKRLEKMRAAAVQYRVWGLAEQLRLREDQVEEVAKIVDQVEGDKLLKELRSGRKSRVGGRAPRSVTPEQLADVLTAKQLRKFKSVHDAQANQFGGLFGGLMGVKSKAQKNNGAAELGLEIKSSAGRLVVDSVKDGSRAQAMGIQQGDIIDQANDKPVDTPFQLNTALKASLIVSITVIRGEQTLKLTEKEADE